MAHLILSIFFVFNGSIYSASNGSQDAKLNQGRKYAIGDEAHGGIIIYLDPTGEHGIICAPRDEKLKDKARMVWGCLETYISGSRGTAIGSGEQNTKDIIATCTKGVTAADVCYKSRQSGYTDWYLPSKGELNAIYKLKKKGKLKLKRTGYWSSTGTGDGNAWVQTFGMGFQFVSSKYGSHRVRPVRKF
ncbi:DUF1566 domain-containing protein [Reichenbachiella sp. MALMAid0571]|uniref:Lcl domain-containing protein n=1 Tax=Reichenbachiella sp. MALMAid0571 TaxID=3143939 RepID=UPI0032DFAF8C